MSGATFRKSLSVLCGLQALPSIKMQKLNLDQQSEEEEHVPVKATRELECRESVVVTETLQQAHGTTICVQWYTREDMTDVHAAVVAAVGPEAAFTKDHQAYFVKSAEKVNSTLHAAICKFCHAQDVAMKDNRTCLWQARDCIRHLARCPHVTEGVRNHFKEEARLLNARLNTKKRTFQEMSSKPENGQELPFPLPSEVAQPAAPAQLPEQAPDAAGELSRAGLEQVSDATT